MKTTFPAHRVETTLSADSSLTLEHLPFQPGQAVEVIILPRPVQPDAGNVYPLRGAPVRLERPMDPVDEEDWEASR